MAQTDKQTNHQTDMATLWLNRPRGPIQWKSVMCSDQLCRTTVGPFSPIVWPGTLVPAARHASNAANVWTLQSTRRVFITTTKTTRHPNYGFLNQSGNLLFLNSFFRGHLDWNCQNCTDGRCEPVWTRLKAQEFCLLLFFTYYQFSQNYIYWYTILDIHCPTAN